MENDKSFHVTFGDLNTLSGEARLALQGQVEKINIGHSAMFTSFNQFMQWMFPKKFELLFAIKTKSPSSLYELAKIVGKAQSGVLQDCHELHNMGFISLTQDGPRKSIRPMLAYDYDEIVVHTSSGTCKHSFTKAA